MPWQRPPSWLYLPHLMEDHPGLSEAADASLKSDEDGAGTVKTDEGGCCTTTVMAPHAVAAFAAPGSMELAASATGHHPSSGSSPNEIRGRSTSLGHRGGARANEPMDHGSEGHVRRIRGPGPGLGQGAGGGRRRSAEDRLAAANSHLWRSLEDHADRVAKRKAAEARDGGRPCETMLSAAERMVALRRRIAMKSTADEREVPRNAAADPRRNELRKMHLLHGSTRIQLEPAGGGSSAVRQGGELVAAAAAVGGLGDGAPTTSAAAAAAHQVAWHTVGGERPVNARGGA
jgi:hypothetical protein